MIYGYTQSQRDRFAIILREMGHSHCYQCGRTWDIDDMHWISRSDDGYGDRFVADIDCDCGAGLCVALGGVAIEDTDELLEILEDNE